MAAPTGFTPIADNVIITVLSGTGISTPDSKFSIGLVEAVGLNVTMCEVGDTVLFSPFGFICISDESWQVVPQSNLKSLYIAAP